MTSAIDRVFAIPSSSHYSHHPWKSKTANVDVREGRRLFSSLQGLNGLVKNAHLVRGIRMDDKFFDHCLVSAAATSQPATGSGPGTASSPSSLAEIVFPRMTNLCRFEYNLPAPDENWCEAPIRLTDKTAGVLPKFSLMMPPSRAPVLVNLT
ncbi:hypothetical protein BGW39_002274 [Mortierella sp. 14UC]|nr:hypothetical protein BGW39_002274 [Mortierella sp. 14UC]